MKYEELRKNLEDLRADCEEWGDCDSKYFRERYDRFIETIDACLERLKPVRPTIISGDLCTDAYCTSCGRFIGNVSFEGEDYRDNLISECKTCEYCGVDFDWSGIM